MRVRFLLVLILFFCVCVFIVVVLFKVQDVQFNLGLLQVLVIIFYIMFVIWLVLFSIFEQKCNFYLLIQLGNEIVVVGFEGYEIQWWDVLSIVGFIIFFLCIFFISLCFLDYWQVNSLMQIEECLFMLDVIQQQQQQVVVCEGWVFDNEQDGVIYSYFFFYFCLVLVLLYVMMMFINWYKFGEIWKMISMWIVVWVKICVSWVGLFFYLWILVVLFFLCNCDFS